MEPPVEKKKIGRPRKYKDQAEATQKQIEYMNARRGKNLYCIACDKLIRINSQYEHKKNEKHKKNVESKKEDLKERLKHEADIEKNIFW